MARPKKIEPTVRVELRLPQSVMERVDALLFSPAHGRVPYDARTKLFRALLENWLNGDTPVAIEQPATPYDPGADLASFVQTGETP